MPAEAELPGIAKGASQALGMRSIGRDLGCEMPILLLTDASAVLGIVRRRGLGRMRHLDIRDLWLQKEVGEGKVVVDKVLGTENPADLMTKVLGVKEIGERLEGMGLRGMFNA